jgi:hypothetical protein
VLFGEIGLGGGGWKNLAKGVSGTKVTVGVPTASAAVLKLSLKR